jgi:Family of unknown function (DUF6165)
MCLEKCFRSFALVNNKAEGVFVSINIELSVGELLDKVTILQIKSERIDDPIKLENINKELQVLLSLWSDSSYSKKDLDKEIAELKSINEALWDIEDKIRDKEAVQTFDQEFIELARSVYFTNDKRADIKKIINTKTGSELIEEKSYSDYSAKSN